MYRYPFPPYPTGWYLALESAALPPGGVVPLKYFGRDLVAFRTNDDARQVAIVDAHCPHMGAHLGHGGVVEGGGLRCPFHAWRFDTSGHCDDVPYDRGRPAPRVSVGCWNVHETSGLILVHYSESGAAPTWHMPDVGEWGQPGWLGYASYRWHVRMHTQEFAENVPDTAHFAHVHGVPGTMGAEIEIDGPVFRQRSLTVEDGHAFTTQAVYGLGLIWLHTGSNIVFLGTITPIDQEVCDLRLLFLVQEEPGATEISPRNRNHIESIYENTGRDIPIWEHKVYREKAPLVPGDGPSHELRKWAKQFYESDLKEAARSAAGLASPASR